MIDPTQGDMKHIPEDDDKSVPDLLISIGGSVIAILTVAAILGLAGGLCGSIVIITMRAIAGSGL